MIKVEEKIKKIIKKELAEIKLNLDIPEYENKKIAKKIDFIASCNMTLGNKNKKTQILKVLKNQKIAEESYKYSKDKILYYSLMKEGLSINIKSKKSSMLTSLYKLNDELFGLIDNPDFLKIKSEKIIAITLEIEDFIYAHCLSLATKKRGCCINKKYKEINDLMYYNSIKTIELLDHPLLELFVPEIQFRRDLKDNIKLLLNFSELDKRNEFYLKIKEDCKNEDMTEELIIEIIKKEDNYFSFKF